MKTSATTNTPRYFILFTFATLLIYAPTLHAQVDTASLTGIVSDSSGATLSGTRVEITNSATNISVNAT